MVLNRPLGKKLPELVPNTAADHDLYYGGPVMGPALVALFRAEQRPRAHAFHVLRGVYLSMHPDAVDPILSGTGEGARPFAGFCGWAPGQLEREMRAEDWYMLPASESIVFRKDTSGLWRELLERARGSRTRAPLERRAILG